MSAVPGLKKKLKSVRTVGKVSKALKTVSAAKFARLSSIFKNYAEYATEYRKMISSVEIEPKADAVIIFGSNRGFCGAFNNDVAQLALDECKGFDGEIIVCGDEMSRVLGEKGFSAQKKFVFDDVPSFSETDELFGCISELADKKSFTVKLIRPQYKNTMTQIPFVEYAVLHPASRADNAEDMLMFPDKNTVTAFLDQKCFRAMLYGAVLETALGAQASTLITMRSAYDTSCEYGEKLENEIHRQRQRDVTADVIETASERGSKGEDDD